MANAVKVRGSQGDVQLRKSMGGVLTVQPTDSSSDFTATFPPATGTVLLDTAATSMVLVPGTNAETQNNLEAALRQLDGLVQANVIQVGLNTPPVSPVDGVRYVVGTSPTGVWAGHANEIARYSSVASAWEFYIPQNGWLVFDQNTSSVYRYSGSTWSVWSVADSLLVHLAGIETITGVKTFLNGLSFGQQTLSNYSKGSWTPNDASGAGLSLTIVPENCTYSRVGDLVIAPLHVSFPTNSNTLQVRIGGLPYTAAIDSGGFIVTINGSGSIFSGLVRVGGTSASFYINPGAASLTNQNLSGATIRGIFVYQA